MTVAPGQAPSRHSPYEPFLWIYWVRIAQLVLTVLVMILSAYAASQSMLALGWGLAFSFWTIVWSIFWIPSVTWGVHRIPANYRPNIIVLVCECCSWFWWLLTFAGLAAIAVLTTATSSLYTYPYRRATTVDPSDPSTYYTSTGSYGSSTSSSTTSSLNDAVNDLLGRTRGAIAATKAATAFAAINWALFVATFIATCVKIHRQRKERLQEIYQGNSNPNVTINNIHVHGTPMEDKHVHGDVERAA